MFLDELSFDELNELEKSLISEIKNVIYLRRIRTLHRDPQIKFKSRIINVDRFSLSFRGKLPCKVVIQYRDNCDLEMRGYYGTYYSHHMLLHLICTAYDLKTRDLFDKFINKLTTFAISAI